MKSEARHIVPSAELAGFGEAIWVYEIGIPHPEFTGLGIHFPGKCRHATGVVTGQTASDVVHALYKEKPEKVIAAVSFTTLEAQLRRLATAILSFRGDG